ncbi:MAG: tRNA (adenosine(37)-N6)-threonylcarbamoyltransferase complex dimerization subunit type 1 TsaB [Proteobacteria bacterium]|nr:tRNA (adenosine(37)-N6)-threonylcarbamoyltransferase complex dimerization subunit type 1 TsaB [Pseudomonadota bacterium]NOG59466.1 tRNA (adenosine(37)-N6)-threonylcarbamoyltransferase complex dimerization subunit type 1 TsaB [Pseudomonadota bacterium]
MKILAIETATEACSAALGIDNSYIQRYEVAPRQHSQLILPMVDELLKEANIKITDLDAIAFGQGPGAFTGVRIAIGVVQGLAFAHDIPVIPVSTLAALAQHFADDHDSVAAAIDARMQEIYWGLFKKNEAGVMQAIIVERVCSPTEIAPLSAGKWFGAGSGWQTYPDELKSVFSENLVGIDENVYPSAEDILTLAETDFLENKAISVEAAAPVYLRNKVADKN